MSKELADRIAAIEARNAVAETIYAYARAIRRHDPRAAADCFHDDGVFEIRIGRPGQADAPIRTRLEGRDGVHAYLTGGDVAGSALCPVIHNMIVRIHGDSAQASSVLVTHQVGGERATLAEYEDRLERRDDAWRLALRICTIIVPPISG